MQIAFQCSNFNCSALRFNEQSKKLYYPHSEMGRCYNHNVGTPDFFPIFLATFFHHPRRNISHKQQFWTEAISFLMNRVDFIHSTQVDFFNDIKKYRIIHSFERTCSCFNHLKWHKPCKCTSRSEYFTPISM